MRIWSIITYQKYHQDNQAGEIEKKLALQFQTTEKWMHSFIYFATGICNIFSPCLELYD